MPLVHYFCLLKLLTTKQLFSKNVFSYHKYIFIVNFLFTIKLNAHAIHSSADFINTYRNMYKLLLSFHIKKITTTIVFMSKKSHTYKIQQRLKLLQHKLLLTPLVLHSVCNETITTYLLVQQRWVSIILLSPITKSNIYTHSHLHIHNHRYIQQIQNRKKWIVFLYENMQNYTYNT